MSYSKPGDTRFTATASAEDVTIYRYRYAGICGPTDEFPLPNAGDESVRFTMEELTTHIESKRFRVIGTWRAVVAYDGIRLEADVEPA